MRNKLIVAWSIFAMTFCLSFGQDTAECLELSAVVFVDKHGTWYIETNEHVLEVINMQHCDDCKCGEHEEWLNAFGENDGE